LRLYPHQPQIEGKYLFIYEGTKYKKNNLKMEKESLEEQLIKASQEENLEKVKECIERGANIHAKDDALYSSAYNGHLEVLKCLIDKGAIDVGILLPASYRGHLEVVRFLLETYKSIYKKHIDLALIYSVLSDNYDLIKYVIEQGANINANDNEALEDASKFHKVGIVLYLLNYGANPLEDNKQMLEYLPVNPRKRFLL
jgi:ankyrin repeat protein